MPKNVPSPLSQETGYAEEKIQQIRFYIKQRQRWLYVMVALVMTGVIGTLLWVRYKNQWETIAQREIFHAVYDFEAGNFQQALEGDGTYLGILDIIQEYGVTKTANLARFYAGVCHIHQQNYEAAIQHLKQVKAHDGLLQARAWALVGDAYTQQQCYPQAITYYLKASDYKPNEFFTPTYLAKAAAVYEKQQDYQAALLCYQRIIKEYPQATLYQEACKHAGRLEVRFTREDNPTQSQHIQ